MNKMTRTGILFLVLALIAAAVISCGKPEETDDEWTPPAKDSETGEGTETPETEAPVDGETELTLPKDEF